MIDLETGIRAALIEVLNINEADVNEATSSETVPQWDSLRHINVIMFLEKSFGVSIGLDQIPNMKSFTSIRDVLSVLIDCQ